MLHILGFSGSLLYITLVKVDLQYQIESLPLESVHCFFLKQQCNTVVWCYWAREMRLLRLFLAPTPITNTQHSGKETIVPPSHNSGVLEQSRGSESQKIAVKRPESIRIKTAANMFNPSRQTQTTHRSYYIQNGTFTPCIDKFSDKQ